MIQQTSIETYRKIVASGLLSDKRLKVYQIFYEHPQGLTGAQVSEIFKSKYPSSRHSETIRNRITELRDMGVLYEMGKTQCKLTHQSVMLFGVTNNIPTKLEKKQTLNEKVDAILKMMVEMARPIEEGELRNNIRLIYREIKNLKK